MTKPLSDAKPKTVQVCKDELWPFFTLEEKKASGYRETPREIEVSANFYRRYLRVMRAFNDIQAELKALDND